MNLEGCDSIQPIMAKLSYDKDGLVHLFKEYYICIGDDFLFESVPSPKSEMGIVRGASLSFLTFTKVALEASRLDYLVNRNYPKSFDWSGGFFKKKNDLETIEDTFFNEFIFLPIYHIDDYYGKTETETKYKQTAFSLGYSHFKLNNQYHFKYIHNDNLSYFFNIHFSGGLTIKGRKNLTLEVAVLYR